MSGETVTTETTTITLDQAIGLKEFVERAFQIGKEGTNADHSAAGLLSVALHELGIRVSVDPVPALPSRDALVASITSTEWPTPGASVHIGPLRAAAIADRIIADAGVTR